jgi:hypothetical protein
MSSLQRKYCRFIAEFENEHHVFLDENGNECNEDDSLMEGWSGSFMDARREADRRSNLYEDKNHVLIGRVIYESMGEVKE